MKAAKPYNLTWRDGRPRWTPSPTVRAFGYKGFDLKTPDGQWMDWNAACAAAAAMNEQVYSKERINTFPRDITPEQGVGRFSAGFIYFLWTDKHIKIGFSTKPFSRLQHLATTVSDPIERVSVLPGTMAEEQRLHRRFRKQRSHGEWFRSSVYLNEIIFEMIKAGTTKIE